MPTIERGPTRLTFIDQGQYSQYNTRDPTAYRRFVELSV